MAIGEEDCEDGSVAVRLDAAADADSSIMFAHDALAYPEPATGSKGILGGENGS